jgi:hypothetical protein
MSQIKCYNCNKFAGHFSRDCKEPRRERKGQKQQHQAHLAKAEEEEPALLLARRCSLDDDNPSLLMATMVPQNNVPTLVTGGHVERVELVEERVYLAKDVQRDDSWFLDTGASNHMTGYRSVFAELDMGVTGTVKFGDGSVVEIQGRGTVLFASAATS